MTEQSVRGGDGPDHALPSERAPLGRGGRRSELNRRQFELVRAFERDDATARSCSATPVESNAVASSGERRPSDSPASKGARLLGDGGPSRCHAVTSCTDICFFCAIEPIGAPSAGDVRWRLLSPDSGSRGGVWPRFLFAVDIRGRVASHRRRRRGLVRGFASRNRAERGGRGGLRVSRGCIIGVHALSRGPLAAGHSGTRR